MQLMTSSRRLLCTKVEPQFLACQNGVVLKGDCFTPVVRLIFNVLHLKSERERERERERGRERKGGDGLRKERERGIERENERQRERDRDR